MCLQYLLSKQGWVGLEKVFFALCLMVSELVYLGLGPKAANTFLML